jgi:hypothetical protein
MKYAALLSLLVLVGCGAPLQQVATVAAPTSSTITNPLRAIPKPHPARAMPLPNLAGQWELSFMPDAQAGGLPGVPQANLAETNLQQSDNTISADSSQLFWLSEYSSEDFRIGSVCLGGETGNIAGTVSDDGLSFSLSLSGDGVTESAQVSGAVNSDGSLTGTYSGNNTGLDGCPLNSTGSFLGTRVTKSFSGTYAGQLANDQIASMETISVSFTQNPDSTINLSGSDNGVAFGLSGIVLGSFFEAPTFVSGNGREQSFDGYLPLNDPRIWLWDEVSGDRGILEVQQ